MSNVPMSDVGMSRSDAPEVLAFEGVSFSYGAGARARVALQRLDLRIRKGEFVAVVGGNGSGKSTLARHANALLVPCEGTVRVCGMDTAVHENHFAIRSCVGMVFQNPENQTVASLVEDDVAFGAENLGLSAAEIRIRVDEALDAVRLAGFQKREVHTLSGGQKQRVAIAAALAMRPEILVLDEPGAMLDVRGRRACTHIAHELNEQGVTVLLITHVMEEAARAHRVVVLDAGTVALEGTPCEVLTQVDALRALRLEPPFAVRLGAALRTRGLDAPVTLRDEELVAWVARQGELRTVGAVTATGEAEDTAADGSEIDADSGAEAQTGDGSAKDNRRALVSLQGVSFAYANGELALSDVALDIAPGAFVGVIGHTGSGKSTMAQLMNALLVPTAGTVQVGVYDTRERKHRRKVRSTVGYVFQYPEHQLFATTVAEEVAFGPRNLSLPADEVERRVRTALQQVGFAYDEVAEESPFELSGGQQRCVALADVLAMEPQVLVLDEPMAGLDPAGCAQVRTVLQELNHAGMAIVLVTHSMDDVAAFCETCVVMECGRIALAGAPAHVFSAANTLRLRELGLDVPQAVAFALQLQKVGDSVAAGDTLPLTLEALVEDILR